MDGYLREWRVRNTSWDELPGVAYEGIMCGKVDMKSKQRKIERTVSAPRVQLFVCRIYWVLTPESRYIVCGRCS